MLRHTQPKAEPQEEESEESNVVDLAAVQGVGGIPSVVEPLDSSGALGQIAALEKIDQLGVSDDSTKEDLLRILDTGNTHLWPTAIKVLLKDPDQKVFNQLVLALDSCPDPTVVKEVLRVLRNDHTEGLKQDVRQYIIRAIGEQLDSVDTDIRQAACDALVTYGVEGAIELLNAFNSPILPKDYKQIIAAIQIIQENILEAFLEPNRNGVWRYKRGSDDKEVYLHETCLLLQQIKATVDFVNSKQVGVSDWFRKRAIVKSLDQCFERSIKFVIDVTFHKQVPRADIEFVESALLTLSSKALPYLKEVLKEPPKSVWGNGAGSLVPVLNVVERLSETVDVSTLFSAIKKLALKENKKHGLAVNDYHNKCRSITMLGLFGSRGLKTLQRIQADSQSSFTIGFIVTSVLGKFDYEKVAPIIDRMFQPSDFNHQFLRVGAAAAYARSGLAEYNANKTREVIDWLENVIIENRTDRKLAGIALCDFGDLAVKVLIGLIHNVPGINEEVMTGFYNNTAVQDYSVVSHCASRLLEQRVDAAIPLAISLLADDIKVTEHQFPCHDVSAVHKILLSHLGASSQTEHVLPVLEILKAALESEEREIVFDSSNYYQTQAAEVLTMLGKPGERKINLARFKASVDELVDLHKQGGGPIPEKFPDGCWEEYFGKDYLRDK